MANQVEITITADPKNAEEGFKKTQSAFGKMADGIKKHRKAIGVGLTALGAGITALGVSAVKSSLDQQVGIARLNQSLENVGTSYDAQAAAIERVIAAQQDKTNFGDEAQREALQKLITIGGKWEGSLEALQVATDLAAGAGMDLNAASLLLGKAIAGETSSLSRYGIVLEKGATQTEIMAALTKQFGGAAEAAADPMTQMKNRLGDLVQVVGDMLLPAMEQLAVLAEKVTRRMIAWTDAHPALTKVLAVVVAALGALALIIGPLLLLLPTMAASVGILSGAFGALSLSMGPITLVILGIAAAITAGILIWQNWDAIIIKLKETFAKVFNFIKGIVTWAFAKITDAYESKLGWLLPGGAIAKAVVFLRDNWETIFNAIRSTIETVFGAIKDAYESKLGWLLPGGALIKAIQAVRRVWGEIWYAIKGTFTAVTDALVGTFTTTKDTVLGIWGALVGGIKGGINIVIGAINAFIRGINSLQIRVPRFEVPGWVPGIGGRGFGGFSIGFPNIPEIPTLAKGGIVNRPTLAMLGERGPEAVVPLGRGGGAGAGMTVNLVINGDVNGMDDFEAKVTSVIRDAILGGGFQGVLARA